MKYLVFIQFTLCTECDELSVISYCHWLLVFLLVIAIIDIYTYIVKVTLTSARCDTVFHIRR